jgi:hypothetical protein
MITMTWTNASADLLGLGSSAVHRCTGIDRRAGIDVSPAPRVLPVLETGVPARRTAARLRPAFRKARPEVWNQTSAHNSIGTNDGTTLGIHSSGRPLS